MENQDPLAAANETIDNRLAAKETKLAQLELQSAQMRKLAAEEDAFVKRLRTFVKEAEAERSRLQREYRRLVSAG